MVWGPTAHRGIPHSPISLLQLYCQDSKWKD